MKKLMRISLLLFLIILGGTQLMAAQQVKVVVNGSPLKLTDQLIAANGKTYISLRDIGTAFGYEFSWSENHKTANIKNDEVIIALQPDNKWYTKKKRDGKVVTFAFNAADVPKMIQNKLYVPIGNFTTVAGGMVEYDNSKNTYNLIYGWNLNYIEGIKVNVFAGNGQKGTADGALADSRFQYAQSLCITDSNDIYIADAGKIRKVINDKVETLSMQPETIKVIMLRNNGNDVYAMSKPYKNDQKEEVTSIFMIEGDTLKEVYTQKTKESKLIDFDVISNKAISVLSQDVADGNRYLNIIYSKDTSKNVKKQVSNDFNCIAAGGERVYLGSSQKASIYCYDVNKKSLKLFAGVDNKHQFVDGSNPLLCGPKRMQFANGCLYVFDLNVLRKISINSEGKAGIGQTVAGKVTAMVNPRSSKGMGTDMLNSSVNPIDFDISTEGILLTDANQFKVMKIN